MVLNCVKNCVSVIRETCSRATLTVAKSQDSKGFRKLLNDLEDQKHHCIFTAISFELVLAHGKRLGFCPKSSRWREFVHRPYFSAAVLTPIQTGITVEGQGILTISVAIIASPNKLNVWSDDVGPRPLQ